MVPSLKLTSNTIKFIFCFLLLATTIASSARILDEASSQTPVPDDGPTTSDTTPPEIDNPQPTPSTTVVPPNPSIEAQPAAPVIAPAAAISNTETPPISTTSPVTTPATTSPVTTPATTSPSGATGATGGAATTDHPTLSFFMHDILGGSHPSGRVVTGIVANSDANNLPFSKPNNQIFPINGGVPLNTINGVINNDNVPSLIGLNGSPTNTLLQNNGNNNIVNGGNNQAFVTAGQLPAGVTLQQLMFGTVTVVDNEITEGHELGSTVLGQAQGFYLASSSDGSSHTLALTTMFHGHNHEIDDTISFFGVHRTASPISHIVVIGGTGIYENAKGYATIETLPHEDQHTTDGLETITHFTVYLTP
ncbi:dirigent protein 24-like [Dorcoceras hygrometricum]|uniref:Dirigent protein n=1 Tax=Dorcoceras hygrometricum TaxID=472368 RepID=A0A2Z7AYG0_9LAMI|nr:dirigent protein 24-like [Dorcoceras hygrometricum]